MAAGRPLRGLVVVHEPGQTAGRIGTRLRASGVRLTEERVCPSLDDPNGEFDPAPPDAFDFVLTLGSQWHAHEPGPISSWWHDELEYLRRADAAGTPVFGVCFGAQMLAAALGGSCHANERDQIGWHSPQVHDDGVADVLAGPWFEWHSDGIVPPPDADVLASDDVGVQAFRQGPHLGVQFHPEVGAGHLAHWLELSGERELQAAGVDVDALVDRTRRVTPGALARCDRLVDWFLDELADP